jgi:hypothetical protein
VRERKQENYFSSSKSHKVLHKNFFGACTFGERAFRNALPAKTR